MSAFLRAVTPGAMALRLVVVVAPVLALLSTAVQGPGPRALLVALVVILSVGGAYAPESPLLTVCLGLVAFWWALATRGDAPVTAVAAAWLVLAAHIAALLVSYGPRELPVDRALLRLWVARGLRLAAAPPALWLLAVLVSGRAEPPGIWVAGLAAAVAVSIAAAVAVSGRAST